MVYLCFCFSFSSLVPVFLFFSSLPFCSGNLLSAGFLGLSSFVYRLFELYSEEFKLYIVLTLIVSYFSIKRGIFQVERYLFSNLF